MDTVVKRSGPSTVPWPNTNIWSLPLEKRELARPQVHIIPTYGTFTLRNDVRLRTESFCTKHNKPPSGWTRGRDFYYNLSFRHFVWAGLSRSNTPALSYGDVTVATRSFLVLQKAVLKAHLRCSQTNKTRTRHLDGERPWQPGNLTLPD